MVAMNISQDPRLRSVQKLQQALDANPVPKAFVWAEGVLLALGNVIQSLRQNLGDPAPDGPDPDSAPSYHATQESSQTVPTIARRKEILCDGIRGLLNQAKQLKNRIQTAAFDAGPVSSAPSNAAVETIRQQGAELLGALEKYHEAETKLLLETMNTDVGTGD